MQTQNSQNLQKYKTYKTPALHDKLTHLNELLFSVEYMIAGGSVLSEIQNTAGIGSQYNDIDLYFQTQKEFNKAVMFFEEELAKNKAKIEREEKEHKNTGPKTSTNTIFGFSNRAEPCLEDESDAARTYFWDDTQIQLIKHPKPFKEILSEFDLVNSQCYSIAPFAVSHAPDVDNIFTHIIRNKIKDMTFNDLNRSLKYKEKKSLDESNIIAETFDLFLNYDDDSFKRSSYAGVEVDSEEKRRLTVIRALIRVCKNSEKFQEYAVIKEDEGLRLPFDMIPNKEIWYIETTNIRYLTYLQALEQQRRGISFDKFKSAEEFMMENFPEELL